MLRPFRRIVAPNRSIRVGFSVADAAILIGIAVVLYTATQFASNRPTTRTEIDLSPSALPLYTLFSIGRMTASYVLSMAFSLIYGYIAAHNSRAERIMMPILDVLQSVPLLSFLPVVMVILTTVLPGRVGIELASIILIFTGQAWNIAYSFYQSCRTVPRELDEASTSYRFNWWYKFRYLELPFGMNGLLWNSVVSWANGWFFLMAAETFRVGEKDFRLQGLGSYLQAAADQGDGPAILLGFLTLIAVVVLMDQLVWQPLLVWASKFTLSMTAVDDAPSSWFFNQISHSATALFFTRLTILPLFKMLDRRFGGPATPPPSRPPRRSSRVRQVVFGGLALAAGIGLLQIGVSLASLPIEIYGQIVSATLSTAARVAVAVVIGLAWTLPVGVLIGINRRLAARLQSLVQIVAAVPATAFFPVLVALMVNLPSGLDGAAVLLMVLGTQWYLLFNIIAGASTIPQELKDVAKLFRFKNVTRWRTLILPVLFPYVITGLNIAAGGAWNASIVAEYTEYENKLYTVQGLGAMISDATAKGEYTVLLAATLTMIITVVATNRLLWNRLHAYAEERYRLD
jgi:NitT/TauT family transport system permease protein